MLAITKIAQTANGNIQFLNASGFVLISVNRNKSVFLDINNSEIVRVGDVITDGSYTPSASIALNPAAITHIGGVVFSGEAQDLIAQLDPYFFG